MTFRHDSSRGSRIKIENSSVGQHSVLVIDTHLELDGTDPLYDREAFDALLAAAEQYMREHDWIDRVDVVGSRKN